MDHKELGTNASVSTSVNDGSTKFALNSPTVQSRNKSYDAGSNPLGKVDSATARPCAIIGPDRVLPPNPDDTMYLKKIPGDTWPPLENIYRRPPDYPNKISDYQPNRNISPRQTFQENMQRIMVPPMFSSMKSNDESSLKNTKLNMPPEAKYCDVPYNINSVNSEHKSVRNPDLAMSNVNSNSPYTKNMPPPYGWPAGVNVRPLRPYGAPEFYQYQEFPSCAGPRPMTMIRPHRPLHEESAQVYSERLYQDANIRFKPYPTVKEKLQQPRYDYISNYSSTFHPPTPLPPHKYDMHKPIHGHPYPAYPPVPFKYLDRRIHEPFVDGYHRSHGQQATFNAFHNQVVPSPYGPIPGNCMQNKVYSDSSSKSINVNKMQIENNNKVYLNLDSRNKNYSVPENIYYNDMNHSQALRGDVLLPHHSTVNINPMPPHSIYRKDNTPLKSYDYNPNYRIFDNINHSLQRLPLQFSPNTISPSDSNTSNDTVHTIGTSQEDCGYVSQSSTASVRSLDSGNMPHDIYRRHSYNNYEMFRNSFHPNGPIQTPKNKISSSNKKNLDVRQFLQMWNEGDEEVSEGNKEAVSQNQAKKLSQNEIINNQEQLYVLGLVNVPNEELGKYDHIQKISKLPENIKGYNNLEILNQYEELLETPHVHNYNKSREYNSLTKSLMDKEMMSKLPRPVSPLDVEAKISQSVIHKEVGCNFEIKPCSPQMLNVELAAPVLNILGERMIEKVINPVTTKSPNLTRNDNIKSQSSMNDNVKVASCKLISDQYSSKSSPIKTNNYCVQDLESNAGLCLASLPQLDNDIELNFTEINQQFIKANQIESNVTTGLQNLLHNIDLDQTQDCLTHELKNDSRQPSMSPQLALGSVVEKEISKLSKYRKGRKSDLVSSPNIVKEDTIKTNESLTPLQRIDSVIIKNPDNLKLQFNEHIKLSSESTHEIQKEPKKHCSSLKYEKNIDKCDFSSEIAIDFSFNRSEDETAVRFLNAFDGNVNNHLPQLEGFDEEGLNEDNNITVTSDNMKIQNAPRNPTMTSSDVVDKLRSDPLQFKITEEYEKNNVVQSSKDGKYNSLIKVSVNSPECNEINDDYNVLVMRKFVSAQPQLPTLENSISSENTKNNKSPVTNIENINSVCQESDKDSLFKNSINAEQSKYVTDIDKVERQTNDESKKEIESIAVKSVTDVRDQYDCDKEISFIGKTCNTYFDNDYNKDGTEKHTIEKVLKDLSNQDNLSNDSNILYHNKNNTNKDFTVLDNSHNINEKSTENETNLSLLSQNNNKNSSVVLDIGISRSEDNCIDHIVYQSVTSEPKAKDIKFDILEKKVEISQSKSEKDTDNTSAIASGTSDEIDDVMIKTNDTDLLGKLAECNSETVFRSTEILPQQDSITKMETSAFACISDINDLQKCNESDYSLSTESFLETVEAKHDSTQVGDATNLEFNVECLSNKSNVNICGIKDKPCILQYETLSVTPSSVELVESREELKTISTTSLQEEEKCESYNMDPTESEYLSYNMEKNVNTVGVPCAAVKTIPKNCAVVISECTQETYIDRNLETNYKMNVDTVKNYVSSKNILSEHPATKNAELRNEKDIAKIEFLSGEAYMNSVLKVEESLYNDHETSNNIIKDINYENLSVKIIECKLEIEMDNSIQDIATIVDTPEPNYLTDPIDEHSLTNSTVITPENFTGKHKEDIKYKELKRVEKSDLNHPENPDLNIDLDLDRKILSYNGITSELKNPRTTKSMKSRSKILHSQKCRIYENTHVTSTQESVIKNVHSYCQKELFSPRIQKLLIFTEGLCKPIANKSQAHDNCSKINNIPVVNHNVEGVLSQNDNTLKSWKNEINFELHNVDNEADSINDINITTEVSQTEYYNDQVSQHNDNAKNKNSCTKNKEEPAPTENVGSISSNFDIKPRKISKRSLSESAIEVYKDNDDIHFDQPSKRKKGIKGNQNFLKSHIITDEICNIIQTNRRNSISTFYNEENVYFVIDDLILTEENEESDKMCYTDSTEEFLTSIQSPNYEINPHLESDFSMNTKQNEICEYSGSLQPIEEKSIEDSWVDDVACIETVFSEDVAENIIIDVQASPKKGIYSDLETVDEESSLFCDSDHIDKIKSIYGRNMCNDNTQLIETLYRTPQMNVNKTLYHIESQDPAECLNDIIESCLESKQYSDSTGILKSAISSDKVDEVDILENISQKSNINHNNDKLKDFSPEEQEDKLSIHSCESSNDYLLSNYQKENSTYSCSSSPEVSSTTSEEKNSSILLKITNCNGSIVSQINEVTTDSRNKLSYKLTEKGDYRSYSSNFSSSRTLITKAAQKYIPPLKETIYDLKVKLPLPQHRLHSLKQLKIAKVKPKVDATANICTAKKVNHDISKKQKPKFEDVLKSIDEINFKNHKDSIKKSKISIPKVIIKKSENGAHYASSKTTNRKDTYNPDLTGRKWQPWVFIEKNNFVDKMALQKKVKAVYCHRKNSYVLLEKFRKYKSIYNANFVITQPKSDTKGNLKYTIRLKHIN